eukprot:6827449-Lingulodinium_polyedra.AAC.1
MPTGMIASTGRRRRSPRRIQRFTQAPGVAAEQPGAPLTAPTARAALGPDLSRELLTIVAARARR